MATLARCASAATFLSWMLFLPGEAAACGGCFSPPVTQQSTVTGHRMAFATSQDRTVLWDQFEYSGAPEDFSWVLPIRPGAYLEESTDSWFESLESLSQTRVTSPFVQCAGGSSDSGCGCVSMSASSLSADDPGRGGGGGVEVLHHGTIGPYDTVTLRSTNGDALTTWLGDNGYIVPVDIEPVIAAYVAEGADFLALRLQPGRGVQQMTPVRVVTPGGNAILPLRMVQAGTGESVQIVLYVIGELRFGMPDLTEVTVDRKSVVWDFAANDSNYAGLRRQALARDIGWNYLTAFADVGAFQKNYYDDNGSIGYQVGSQYLTNFADLYFAQARANEGLGNEPPCPSVVGALGSTLLVREDASPGELDATSFVCDDYSDIAAAMIGMHPSRVWTTRLELDLPREALVMDCVVTASETQEPVSRSIQATRSKNTAKACPGGTPQSRVAPVEPDALRAWLVAMAIAGALLVRRRGTNADA